MAFLGAVLDDFGLALTDDACVKAPALAINILVNLDAVLDAHAERDIRILADAVKFFADMRTVEVQLQNAAFQAVPERQRNHVGHASIVHHRDMAGRTLLDNLRDILVPQNFSVFASHIWFFTQRIACP